jgi:hypothetical protein
MSVILSLNDVFLTPFGFLGQINTALYNLFSKATLTCLIYFLVLISGLVLIPIRAVKSPADFFYIQMK